MWKIDAAGKNVVIAAVGVKGSTFEQFLANLPPNDCRYGGAWGDGGGARGFTKHPTFFTARLTRGGGSRAREWNQSPRPTLNTPPTTHTHNTTLRTVFDYTYTNSEGISYSKIVFLNWAPDTANIRSKMMFASTKDHFKNLLDGISVEFQVRGVGGAGVFAF